MVLSKLHVKKQLIPLQTVKLEVKAKDDSVSHCHIPPDAPQSHPKHALKNTNFRNSEC